MMPRLVSMLLISVVWLGVVRADERPVEIRVVDAKTLEPVERFHYSYRILSPDKHDFPARGRCLPGKNGLVRIPAPRRLGLSIHLVSPDYLPQKWIGYSIFKVTPDDQKRRFEVKLESGDTLRGVVLDQDTNRPMVGIEVAPMHAAQTGFGMNNGPDWMRSVRTDAKGRFHLGGHASLGVAVCRQGIWTNPISEDSSAEREVRKTSDGQSEVVIRLPDASDPLRKGWFSRRVESNQHLPGKKVFRGVVTMADDPTAKGKCTVIVAAVRHKTWWHDPYAPWGDTPDTKDHVRLEGIPLGKTWSASIETDESDKAYYVAALREGFSPTVIRMDEDEVEKGVQPIRLELKQGVRISGSVSGPGVDEGTAVAMLFPHGSVADWQGDNELEWLTRTTPVAPDGSFQFEPIEPGLFRLQVLSKKAGPYDRIVVVSEKDKALEPCRIKSFGRIEGILHDLTEMYDSPSATVEPRILARASWAKPIVFHEKLGLEIFGPSEFVTDEQGRFVIEQAPAGPTFAGYMFRATLDSEGYARADAMVRSGQTAKIVVNQPLNQVEGLLEVPLNVVIGEGSFDALCHAWGLHERPTDDDNLEYWPHGDVDDLEILFVLSRPKQSKVLAVRTERLRQGTQTVLLEHVKSDDYRLQIKVGWGESIPIFATDLPLRSKSKREPVRVPLPASSIECRLIHNQNGSVSHKDGSVSYALFRVGEKRPFRFGVTTRTEGAVEKRARHVLPLVPPGRYEVLFWMTHSASKWSAWTRSEPFEVQPNGITNIGRLTFRPGASVTGHLHLDQESKLPTIAYLIDPNGVRRWTDIHWTGEEFTFQEGSLWPGRWSVEIIESIAKTTFEVQSVESIELQIQGK